MVTAPKLWLRFVDDILSIIKRQDIGATLRHLYEQHPDVRFTMEIEEDHGLPFLDAMITRHEQKLKTKVYRKPTDTG